MINSSDHRLLLPETIWLETEDYERAKTISNGLTTEKQSWQTYLNLLALFSLETWLAERLGAQKPEQKIDLSKQTYYLQVGDFTITAIAVDNLLNELVCISEEQLQNQITHFYVVIEINEEAEEAIFRGLLRRDLLAAYLAENGSLQPVNGYYSFPLSWFDNEPNHLLAYCQYLSPTAISLPVLQTKSFPTLQETVTITRTKLTQWLQNTVTEGWSAIETLIEPEMNLAFSTRSVAQEYQRGKLINLGVELNHFTLALLVTVTEEADEKLGVRIQLYPTSREQFLPAQVQLTLLSKAGKILQSVQARERDNYIQLKTFKGKPGKCFSLEVTLEGNQLREDFEL